MSQMYKKSFKIIVTSFFVFMFVMLATQAYFFYQSKIIENAEKNKELLLEKSESILEEVQKVTAKGFNFFKIESLFKDVNSVNSRINKLHKGIGIENIVPEREKRINDFKERFSGLNLSNKNLWENYVDSYVAFLSYVKSNNWKTLTRISQRVNIRTPRKFFFEKDINYLLGVNLKDLVLAQDVTKKSSLTNTDKKNILDRSEKLIILTNLLIEKNTQASRIRNSYFLSLKSLEMWSEQWKKKSSSILSKSYQKGFVSSKSFSLMILITLLMSFIVAYITRKVFKILEEKSDRETIIALDKIVVKDDLSFLDDKNDSYRSAIFTLNDYVKRRISFGQIFQQTIPFPCILLDENLSFKWFNNLLVEQLSLDEETLESENLVWDTVRDRLQLSDADPVLEAIQNGIAGIFQVTLDKGQKNRKTFQMYVNPVSYGNKNFVMLILYPLLTIEETMSLQFKTIVSPVHNALDTMLSGEGNELKWKELRKEFVVADSLNLYEKFVKLDEKFTGRFLELRGELDKFEELTTNLFNTNSSVKEFSDENLAKVDSLQENFKNLKNSLVKLSDQYQYVVATSNRSVNDVRRLFNDYSSNIEKDFSLNATIEKVTDWGIPSIRDFKLDLKKFKEKLKTLGKVDKKEVQDYLANQEKVLTNIDLFLSKLEMLLEDLSKYKLDDNSNFLKTVQDMKAQLDEDARSIGDFSLQKENLEEELVSFLKSFYEDVKEIGNTTVSISEEVIKRMPEGSFSQGEGQQHYPQ